MDSARVSVPSQFVHDACGTLHWRVDLFRTEQYWRGWFENLSVEFLRAPGAKLLVLAGPDRLDKHLMIAQMQGKFQIKLMPNCGHVVHEDAPQEVAAAIIHFAVRFAKPVVFRTFKT
eukprot:TRINITY_DN1131_c0_g1_i2.p1 TRINITY_DN1131_c0_g1~~TRINITY_DN1131_c0_g1_i2.p1  ORF type:complete len:135 (+),score=38.75 TRINITY_DN1131_c0_g1_i2:56-406(+)